MNGHDIAVIIASALPSLIGLIGLHRVGQVHKHVRIATNGQHEEIVRSIHELLRRLEAVEEEVGAAQSAIVAQIAKGPTKPPRRRWPSSR